MGSEARTDLLIGSYAAADQDSIFRYCLDGAGGKLKFLASVGGIENPSYIVSHHHSKLLFAISETKQGNDSLMATFSLGPEIKPVLLSELSYEGSGACHISLQRYADLAISANYGGGSLAVLAFDRNGQLRQAVQLFRFKGSGPNHHRQEQPHVHSSMFSPDYKMLFVADLGADRIYTYRYDQFGVQPFSPTASPYITLPGGVGPRHMAFHPSGMWFYVLCELTGGLFVFSNEKFDRWLYRYTIAKETVKNGAEAADIKIDRTGKYLYTSNRGNANEIVIFSIDQQSGMLQEIQRIPSGGDSPRCLAIDPFGRYLFCANEKGNSITSFQILPNGRLIYFGVAAEISSPTCLHFLEVKPGSNF